ncbi:hypothetical protein LFX13_19205, partial [Leptospira bandrabouensis]|nr:hypothetical protein [Leptospira bandrabouensis]
MFRQTFRSEKTCSNVLYVLQASYSGQSEIQNITPKKQNGKTKSKPGNKIETAENKILEPAQSQNF